MSKRTELKSTETQNTSTGHGARARAFSARVRGSVLAVLLIGAVLAVVGGTATSTSAQTTTTVDPNAPDPVEREFAGEDRYETAVAIATSFAQRSSTAVPVILAGGNLIDAAAAAGVARATGAPVLLTESDRLSEVTKQFIIDRQINTVFVLGGEAAISAAVVAEVQAILVPPAPIVGEDPVATEPTEDEEELVPVTVVRLAGANRYDTSVVLARQVGEPGFFCGTEQRTVVMANVDRTFADVIAVGPLAYSLRAPVLLTDGQTLTPLVTEYLRQLNVEHVLIVGGEAAVSPAVEAQIAAAGIENVRRVSGETRYHTALNIRQMLATCSAIELSSTTFVIVNGDDPASGIAAGPLLGSGLGCNGVTPVLLVEANQLPEVTRAYLASSKERIAKEIAADEDHDGVFVTVIGNDSLVADAVVREAADVSGTEITQGLVSEQESCLRTYYQEGIVVEDELPPPTTIFTPPPA